MSSNNRVIWSEGMFLRPQHFQQYDRYLESLVAASSRPLRSFGWGVSALALDQEALGLGKLAIAECRGVLPDGTPFNVPGNDDPPAALDVPADVSNAAIFLALPLRRAGGLDVTTEVGGDTLARYEPVDSEVRDNSGADRASAEVRTGKLRLSLAIGETDAGNFARIPIARVVERRTDGMVMLDEAFIPTCLGCAAAEPLQSFLNELRGLLRHRAESLADRVTHAGAGGVSEVGDYLMLQVINRAEPLFAHLAGLAALHPEDFYRVGLQLAGELATFTHPQRRAATMPPYEHDNLQTTFAPLFDELRRSFSMAGQQSAVPLPLEDRNFGVRVAQIADRELLTSANIVLAVNADLPTEAVITQFPRQVKIGAVENIADLVNLQLPGIGVRQLPVAPREVPFHAGFTYFELDKKSDHWPQLLTSGGIAIHVGAEIPGVQMELWAIRE